MHVIMEMETYQNLGVIAVGRSLEKMIKAKNSIYKKT